MAKAIKKAAVKKSATVQQASEEAVKQLEAVAVVEEPATPVNQASLWQKNQVLISAIAGALALVLQQFIAEPVIDYKALGLAAATAVAGIIANEWRGKGPSILGLIGVAGWAFYSVATTGHITIPQIIASFILGVLSLVAPPPKSIGYEKSPIIKAAKKEGEIDVPTNLPPKPDA
jgi:uncharacterized membrane protein YjjB (DUF3815 family)